MATSKVELDGLVQRTPRRPVTRFFFSPCSIVSTFSSLLPFFFFGSILLGCFFIHPAPVFRCCPIGPAIVVSPFSSRSCRGGFSDVGRSSGLVSPSHWRQSISTMRTITTTEMDDVDRRRGSSARATGFPQPPNPPTADRKELGSQEKRHRRHTKRYEERTIAAKSRRQ